MAHLPSVCVCLFALCMYICIHMYPYLHQCMYVYIVYVCINMYLCVTNIFISSQRSAPAFIYLSIVLVSYRILIV